MSSLRAGDILLFKYGGLISKLIKWGTSSIYSHCAVCVDPDKNLLIEAQGRVRAEDIRRMTEYDTYRVKSEYEYNLNDVVSFLVDKLNRKYDYLGVVYLGLLKLLSRLKFPLKNKANKWQKEHDYFCSELTYNAFLAGGLDIVPQVKKGEITSPGDIAKSEITEKV